jgi:hypothetical protein
MTTANETTTTNRNTGTYDTMQGVEEIYGGSDRQDHRLTAPNRILKHSLKSFRHMTPRLIPGNFEDEHNGERNIFGQDRSRTEGHHRGFRRRLFLILTEPSSSWLSAVFFFFLIVAISVSNLITIMQTMSSFQHRPTECDFCRNDGGFYDVFTDYKTSTSDGSDSVVECVCPLLPYPYLERLLGFILNFFAFEWTLRVLSYVPTHPRSDIIGQWGTWLKYLTSTTTLLDALATWPYFIERYDLPGLISLRLLRLLRVFQVVRLGSYNSLFVSLTSVLYKSIAFLKLLIVIVFFGATIFGSLLFW